MREDLNQIQIPEIPISSQLASRVGEALAQVRGIHRKRLLRRAGTVAGSFVAVVGLLFGVAAVNPALASQIPLVGNFLGGLFYENNHMSKTGGTGAYLDTYDVLKDVNVAAVTENAQWGVTFQQGYSDGNTVQVSLALTGPNQDLDRYSGVDVGNYGRTSTATINGEAAELVGVNPFYERNGQWTSTLSLTVPESQREAETLEVALTLRDLSGRVKGDKGESSYQTESIQGDFEGAFSLIVDRAHEFSFTSDAEDNGAKVLAVSGTPTQTVVTIEKPYWGDVTPNVPADGSLGYPFLCTPDGETYRIDFTKTTGYDYQSKEPQTADLYFDGLPAGTTQAVLRFYDTGTQQEEVLAEFTIDLEAQTVTPSTTYDDGGLLDLDNPYRYLILQNGGMGKEENGFSVMNVTFEKLNGYTGSVYFTLPAEQSEANLRVEVYDSQSTLLWESNAYNSDGSWNDRWKYSGPEDSMMGQLAQEAGEAEAALGECQVSGDVTGLMVPIGEKVTVKIIDMDTGETLYADTRTLDAVQR